MTARDICHPERERRICTGPRERSFARAQDDSRILPVRSMWKADRERSFARAQDDSRILPVRSMWKADRERSFPFVSLRASAHALRMTAGLKFTPMGQSSWGEVHFFASLTSTRGNPFQLSWEGRGQLDPDRRAAGLARRFFTRRSVGSEESNGSNESNESNESDESDESDGSNGTEESNESDESDESDGSNGTEESNESNESDESDGSNGTEESNESNESDESDGSNGTEESNAINSFCDKHRFSRVR
jgi:hypothetical protein